MANAGSGDSRQFRPRAWGVALFPAIAGDLIIALQNKPSLQYRIGYMTLA
jgi:hypothetical protein